MTPVVEGIAVALGLAYVILAARQQRLCWIAGGISSALFLGIFWSADLPVQSALQGYYLLVALHGWHHWGRASNGGNGAPVARWRLSGHVLALTLVALLTTATVLLRDTPTTPITVLDAGTGWGSALATWMAARKILENWLYWIAIDLLAGLLYLHSGLYLTALLYALYSIIAVIGWIQWRRSLEQTDN